MFESRNKRKLSASTMNPNYEHNSADKRTKVSDGVSIELYEQTCLDQLLNNVDIDEDWSDFGEAKEVYKLDLSIWQRCKVLTVERCPNRNLLVYLEEKRSKEKAKCYVAPPWNTLDHIVPGLTVSVLAVKTGENTTDYLVDCNNGFFVTDPDQLISGTTVVSSLFCRRRGVLQEMFRMVDPESQQMHLGSLVHAVFQECITDCNCRTVEDVRRISESWLTSRKTISTLFDYKIQSAEAINMLAPYIEEIAKFLQRHVYNKKTSVITKDGKVEKKESFTIHKVNDIEENIWCHQLGIKGRIDATVSVASDSHEPNTGHEQSHEVMPLELKTGRASYSFEHTGQLTVYTMMMNLVGHNVDSGLLVYLREGKVTRVAGNRNTRRDLIMLRNEIAHYFDRWMIPNVQDTPSMNYFLPLLPRLPEPINNKWACAKCPYNTVCIVMAQKQSTPITLTENHGLSLIAKEASGHLTNSDIDYFILWTGLIYVMREESSNDYSVRKLWTCTPEERVQRGSCVAGLILLNPVRKVDGSYYHTFCTNLTANDKHVGRVNCMTSNNGKPEGNTIFEVGDYIVCSTKTRIAVAAGFIQSFIGGEIIAAFERDLSTNYSGEVFLLDRNEPYKLGGFGLTNLSMLLNNTEAANRLRRIIIAREIPIFTDNTLFKKSMMHVVKTILQKLNHHQKHAVLKAASTNSYCLLKGLPGTGKTQTIVGLVRLLNALGLSVLLTSNTHSAVDNVLKRLVHYGELKFIRLGPVDRIDPAIREYSAHHLTEHCSTSEQLAQTYQQFNIVAVTCLGMSHPVVSQRTFDYCIVDEATQVFQSSIIRPLLQSKRFLLVGDPEQLPPVIKSNKARSLGAAESLFHRLDQEGSFFILPIQYRMNRVLTQLANNFTYNGKLVCGNDLVANATLSFLHLSEVRKVYEVEKWLLKTISGQIELSIVTLDTGNTYRLNMNNPILHNAEQNERKDLTKKLNNQNVPEVALVIYVCAALLRLGVESSAIGIMAPFRAQVNLLRQYTKKLLQNQKKSQIPNSNTYRHSAFQEQLDGSLNDDNSIEVNTVDQYQGKDKKVIIYSCTRTLDMNAAVANEQSDENGNEVLNDMSRLTVAITRAKQKLIMLGDWHSLDKYPPFRKFLKATSTATQIKLEGKKDGFEWENVLDALSLLAD